MAGEQRYLAYMVRLWTVQNNDGLIWRASVENAHTGERHAFADLAGLFAFLQAAVAAEPAVAGQMEGNHEEN